MGMTRTAIKPIEIIWLRPRRFKSGPRLQMANFLLYERPIRRNAIPFHSLVTMNECLALTVKYPFNFLKVVQLVEMFR